MGADGPGHAFVMTPKPELDGVQLPFSIMWIGSETSSIPYPMMFKSLIQNGMAP